MKKTGFDLMVKAAGWVLLTILQILISILTVLASAGGRILGVFLFVLGLFGLVIGTEISCVAVFWCFAFLFISFQELGKIGVAAIAKLRRKQC